MRRGGAERGAEARAGGTWRTVRHEIVPLDVRGGGWAFPAEGGRAFLRCMPDDLASAISQNERLAQEIRATAESMEREFAAGGGAAGDTAPLGGKPEPRIVRFLPHDQIPTLADGQSVELVAHMRDWDYGPGGVFARQEELEGHALFHTTAQGIHHFNLCAKLGVNPDKLHNWLLAVENCMRGPAEVPYHNSTHVCDVVHATWWFLEEAKLADLMAPRAIFAVLCAAVAHDTGHPGECRPPLLLVAAVPTLTIPAMTPAQV